jgi:hypothetical protein
MPGSDTSELNKASAVNIANMFEEIGRQSRNRSFDGRTYDRFVPELSGDSAIQTYSEMANNSPTLGAVLYTIETLAKQVPWHAKPASAKPKAKQAKKFLEENLEDMSQPFSSTVADILTMIPFGWSYHEVVYKYRRGDKRDAKQRSRHNDGLIGWRKWPIREQVSRLRWAFDDKDDDVAGMWQQVDSSRGVEGTKFIPIDKALLFKTHPAGGAPEGRSLFRKAYRPWYFARHIEEIEAIGIERDLAGLPKITAPEDLNLWDPDDTDMLILRDAALNLVRQIRANEAEGVVLPGGWEAELMSSSGRRQIEPGPVIDRYNRSAAMTMLGDFLLVGHESVGSYSMVDAKTNLFAMGLGGFLIIIQDTSNRHAVEKLFRLNQSKFPPDSWATLERGDVETPDPQELATYVKDLTGSGALVPGPLLEEYLRAVYKMPTREEDKAARELEEADEAEALARADQALQAAGLTTNPNSQVAANGQARVGAAGGAAASRNAGAAAASRGAQTNGTPGAAPGAGR